MREKKRLAQTKPMLGVRYFGCTVLIIFKVVDRDFFVLFLRAIIWFLIFNYSSLKRGLSVKGVLTTVGSSQFLHNLVLFKLF